MALRRIQIRAALDAVQGSLFFTPLLFVVVAVGCAVGSLQLDQKLSSSNVQLFGLGATVDSARAVLTTVASATMTVAGISFSVALLIFQLTSNQYSPRVVHSLFRDKLNKRVMGLVVGTFTYCLLVLHATRDSLAPDGTAIVPSASVGLAVLLGVSAVLAIIAFISHNAHKMNVSEILNDVAVATKSRVKAVYSEEPSNQGQDLTALPTSPGFCVRSNRDGWIQQVDSESLLCVPRPGGIIKMETGLGQYVIEGSPICTLWPLPTDDETDEATKRVEGSIEIGKSRALVDDVGYGVRQLTDVALRALSPGINDPTTAQDSILHAVAVLREMFARVAPPAVEKSDSGTRLVLTKDHDPRELFQSSFRELRIAAEPHPMVLAYLLEALHLLRSAVEDSDIRDLIDNEANLVMVHSRRSDATSEDKAWVEGVYQRLFEA